jgi:hypothetical protein
VIEALKERSPTKHTQEILKIIARGKGGKEPGRGH